MTKAKLLTVSGLSSAVALLAMIVGSYATWLFVAMCFVASVAVCLPYLASKKLVYSVLATVASGVIGLITGASKLYYVLAMVCFAMPMAIVKCYGESRFDESSNQTLSDPFEDKMVTVTSKQGTPKLKAPVRWILYYLFFNVALALSLAVLYGFVGNVPALEFFEKLKDNGLVWLFVALSETLVIPYNYILAGCLKLARDTLIKAKLM